MRTGTAPGQLAVAARPRDEIDIARLAGEGLVDVVLAVADHNDAGGVGEALSCALRRLDPAHGFLVLEAPLVAMRLHFGGRTVPNLRPYYAQKRFIVGVDGDKQMNKEAETCPVAAQPQLPPLVAPGKNDLGRVLRHDNAPTAANLRRALGGLLRDCLRGRLLRSEKAMGGYLPHAVSAKLANHQCPEPAMASRIPPQIDAKLEYRHRNQRPSAPPENRGGVESEAPIIRQPKQLDCVNAVGPYAGASSALCCPAKAEPDCRPRRQSGSKVNSCPERVDNYNDLLPFYSIGR